MGWAYGLDRHGREIGYGVEAWCDEPGCDARIDRGLGYACGDTHDAEDDCCDGYFCATHLYLDADRQRCWRCSNPAGRNSAASRPRGSL